LRPTLRFLDDKLIEKIISEARILLCKLGVEIHNDYALSLLAAHGRHYR
jgi:trimethylamine:corrinoid methyltransferase-like protein